MYTFTPGTAWKHIPFNGKLSQVGVGEAGVWALISGSGYVNYLTGSRDSEGTSWESLGVSFRFKSLSVGEDIVVAVSHANQPWVRIGK